MVEAAEKNLHLTCKSLSQLPEIAAQIIEFKGNLNVITFKGELGAGKTTLIKSICQHLGVTDNVTSPTFAIINEYVINAGKPVYHFDFYRINNQLEALDIGVDEYFYSGDMCLIEWPSIVQSLLPENHASVTIEITEMGTRVFHMEKNG